jgi:phage tail sheath protein FI
MPVTVSYPGVYVEEISSGVRTITGVATSITAFIGRAARGTTNKAVTINSFGDFEREFGGLGEDYPMSYAVKDFYLNGGSQAIIVRLYNEDAKRKVTDAAKTVAAATVGSETADAAAKAARTKADSLAGVLEKKVGDLVADEAEKAAAIDGADAADVQAAASGAVTSAINSVVPRTKSLLSIGKADDKNLIIFEAVSDGVWGNNLRVRVEGDVPKEVTKRYLLEEGEMFNLLIHDSETGVTERFMNVSVKPSVRQLDKVLKNESNLVGVSGTLPEKVPDISDKQLLEDKEGSDEAKSKSAIEKLNIPPFESDDRSQKVTTEVKKEDEKLLVDNDYLGSEVDKTGIYALADADLFNLLCIPPDTREGNTSNSVYNDAMVYCAKRRAMLIVDSPSEWNTASKARDGLDALSLTGTAARNAAIFFPRVLESDSEREGQIDTFVPCGIIAGVMARTDTQRGVWKAPAGIDAAMNGAQGLSVNLTDAENGMLNPLGINCLRSFPVYGRVVWGARTLRGADQLADEYKYIPVRRTALYIEESLFRGLKWVVFEPNDEPLWAQIRLNVGAFMHNLFRQGAFQGTTPKDAYFVKCDKETTTQNDVNLGIVNISVGFAPLKPAEFVIIKLQQMAGQIEV